MTATLIAPAELGMAEFEFEVGCYGCGAPAVVVCKGCNDVCPILVCAQCFASVQQRFEDNVGKQCEGCHRPWWDFDTHYSVMPL